MISLTKAVRRKTRRTYAVLYVNDPRSVIVSLEPGDVITFREAGRRQVWSLPVDRMFRQAVRETTQTLQRQKQAAKRNR